MPDSRPPTDLRRHRAASERNYLLGFFAILFIVGGGLIFAFYGAGASVLGLACMAVGAVLTGIVILMVLGLEWLSRWLERD